MREQKTSLAVLSSENWKMDPWIIFPPCCLPLCLGLVFPFFQAQENASGHSRTPQVLQPISLGPWVPAQGSGCLRPHVPLSGGWVSLGIHPCHLQGCPTAWEKAPSSDLSIFLAKRTFPWAPSSHPPAPAPQRHFPVWSQHSQDWAEWQKSLPFPANSQYHFLSEPAELAFYPAQKVAAWLTQSILSDIPSGSSSLNEAMSLSRDSGDDKPQDLEEKDHPGTMGMMGTVPALLEKGSLGKRWYFTHYLWNYTECQHGRCYPLSQHKSNIKRNMEMTYFLFEHNVGLQKKGCPKTHGLQARFSNMQLTSASQMKGVGCATQVSHHNKLLGIRGTPNHLCDHCWTLCESPWRTILNF